MQIGRPADTVFAGSIPAIYDSHMVPLLFRPYARLIAERAKTSHPARILETAAGTGVVTEELHAALPDAEIVATDLNEPMLAQAAGRVTSPNVTFQYADALDLPFPDETFDLVVCQFGVMFFPDKVRGNAEALRTLRAGGRYLLVIWDEVGRNLATKAVGTALAELFPGDTAAFYERLPFRYHDRATIRADLSAAGFERIEIETIELAAAPHPPETRQSRSRRVHRCDQRSSNAVLTRWSWRRMRRRTHCVRSKALTVSTLRCQRTS